MNEKTFLIRRIFKSSNEIHFSKYVPNLFFVYANYVLNFLHDLNVFCWRDYPCQVEHMESGNGILSIPYFSTQMKLFMQASFSICVLLMAIFVTFCFMSMWFFYPNVLKISLETCLYVDHGNLNVNDFPIKVDFHVLIAFWPTLMCVTIEHEWV
jgi:hypothetical protein